MVGGGAGTGTGSRFKPLPEVFPALVNEFCAMIVRKKKPPFVKSFDAHKKTSGPDLKQ